MPDSKRKKLKWAIFALSMLFLLGCVGFTAWKQLAPIQARPKPKPVPAASHDTKKMTPEERPEKKSPVRQVYNSASTLGDLSRKRAQRMILEQQVRIAELEQRLKDLAAPKRQEIILPDLIPPKAAPVPAPAASPRPRGPVVVSVQGVGGLLSANIRTSEGKLVTVKNGTSFAGGIVQVTRKGVSVRRNGKLSAIPFE